MVFIKVSINQNVCMGCGTCTSLCVKVFELADSLEKARIRSEYRGKVTTLGEIPKDVECVRLAVNKCPLDAIEIIEE